MTHIYSFPYSPASNLPAVAWTDEVWGATQRICPGLIRFERPAETALERLKAGIEYIKHEYRYPRHTYPDVIEGEARGRLVGIIEVVLTSTQCEHWRQTIEELGFREVNSSLNSNSNNTIHVFHLNTEA